MSAVSNVSNTSRASLQARDVTLLELVDRLLDNGVVLVGDITISVADVDLIVLGLRLLLASAEHVQQTGMGPEIGSYDTLARLDGASQDQPSGRNPEPAVAHVVRPAVAHINQQIAAVAEDQANRAIEPIRQAMASSIDRLVEAALGAVRDQIDQLLEPLSKQVLQSAEQALVPLRQELSRQVSQSLTLAIPSAGGTARAATVEVEAHDA